MFVEDAERALGETLRRHLPEEASQEIFWTIRDYVEAVRSDLKDEINSRGRWDPDY